MKRIALLLAALVGLAACTKNNLLPEDGLYVPALDGVPAFGISLNAGQCVCISWAGGQITSVTTSGHYPKYRYRCSGDTFRFDVQATFTAQDAFTASVDGSFIIDGTATNIDWDAMPFSLR